MVRMKSKYRLSRVILDSDDDTDTPPAHTPAQLTPTATRSSARHSKQGTLFELGFHRVPAQTTAPPPTPAAKPRITKIPTPPQLKHLHIASYNPQGLQGDNHAADCLNWFARSRYTVLCTQSHNLDARSAGIIDKAGERIGMHCLTIPKREECSGVAIWIKSRHSFDQHGGVKWVRWDDRCVAAELRIRGQLIRIASLYLPAKSNKRLKYWTEIKSANIIK